MKWYHFVIIAAVGGVIGNLAYDMLKARFRPGS
jgi:hypothetical protein